MALITDDNSSVGKTSLSEASSEGMLVSESDVIMDSSKNESLTTTAVTLNENSQKGEKAILVELLKQRELHHPTSNLDTLMHIFKGNIGTGILALPSAMTNSGLAFGIVGLVVIAIMCVHCMHIVLQSARHLCVRLGVSTLTFAGTAEMAFASGPKKVQKYAKAARFITNLFLCLTQLGFCCVYFTFISGNLQEVVKNTTNTNWDIRIYATIILLPITLTCLIPNLKYLVPASLIANLLQFASLAIVFYYIFQDLPSVQSRKQFSSVEKLPLWFGSVIYAFEGIGLILPLENNMKEPMAYGGLTGVLNTGMTLVCVLYIAVAFYGYLKYGDDCKGSITLNLPEEPLSEFVRAAYAAATLLSFCLQFYVPMVIMWPTVKQKVAEKYQVVAEIAFKCAFVLLTYALAILVPQLNLFISLVGAFGGSYLSVMIPPIIEIVTFWPVGITWYVIAKDIIIILIGFVGFGTGTYASIYQIITTFGDTS